MKKFLSNLYPLLQDKSRKIVWVAIQGVVLILLFAITSCEKPNKICNVDSPLTDLPWLKQMVANFSADSLTTVKIHQCTYQNNKTGFLIEPCVGCPDAGYSFRSCDGTVLCGGGGISGEETCQELDIDFNNKQLIYQHN
jgi:hypothetical protein